MEEEEDSIRQRRHSDDEDVASAVSESDPPAVGGNAEVGTQRPTASKKRSEIYEKFTWIDEDKKWKCKECL